MAASEKKCSRPKVNFGRWCKVCDAELITCRNYIKLDSSKSLRTGLLESLRDIVEEDDACKLSSGFLCRTCVAKINNVTKLTHLRNEVKESYDRTKNNHDEGQGYQQEPLEAPTGTTGSKTPTKKQQKRPAVFSPGTPHSKPQPKRLSAQNGQDKENKSSFIQVSASAVSSGGLPSARIGEKTQERASKGLNPVSKARASLSFGASSSARTAKLKIATESLPRNLHPPVKGRSSLSLSGASSPRKADKLEIIVPDSSNRSKTVDVPDTWKGAVSALSRGDESEAADHATAIESVKCKMKSLFLSEIKRETDELCKPASNSVFRDTSLSALEGFAIETQEKELQQKAPLFLSVLEAAAESDRLQKNISKTKESIQPNIMTSAGILLNCKSQQMNSHQLVSSLVLKESGAKKQAFSRFHARGVAASYQATINLQSELGKDFDKEVKEWANQVHLSNETERELLKKGDVDGLKRHEESRSDKGYQVDMDNVDVVVHARRPTRDNYGRDYHMVQMIAVQNRIDAHHLSNEKPEKSHDIDTKAFLPSVSDNLRLKQEWAVLCGNVITDHLPTLKPELQELPRKIFHEHMQEAKMKSKVINLGVLMENENTSDGIYKIMHKMHEYVPGHNTPDPTKIISAGDLLTCERESNCIEEQRNSTTASKRLEGLVPVIADFHALANFYQIVWKHLYDASSGGDKGTLYAARNYLQARNVTTDPMKNINAAAHLLEQYTIALVLAAALDHFGMKDTSSPPTRNLFSLQTHGDRKNYAKRTMEDFVEKYALPSQNVNLNVGHLCCSFCQKTYTSRRKLNHHIREKHPGNPTNSSTRTTAQEHDGVQSYAIMALGMGLLALNFNNARQLGDGGRIVHLYKFMLLHCKAARKPKYSYHILRLLAQVKLFLSPRLAYELVWNRFINTSGREEGNVEVDRVLEHHNRNFKESWRGLRGKITQKSVDRISRSAQKVDTILSDVDKRMASRGVRASKKPKVDRRDAVALAIELADEDIFGFHPGRTHSRFPDFPSSAFHSLEPADVHEWIKSTIKKLSRQNQF